MSVKADRKDLEKQTQDLSVTDVDQEERLTSPAAARGMHSQHVNDDGDASFNRAAVQELKDFVPPYDPADLAKRRMSDRFNVNFGLVASYINEAVGAYHDLFTSPPALVKIVLDPDVDADKKDSWAAIMSEEWTKMFRSWDGAPAKMLALADVFVTHGVVIPWFKDKASMVFDVFSMEECKFPPDTVAIPSQVEFMTLELKVSLPELYSKLGKAAEGKEYNEEGWNEKTLKWLITTSVPESTEPDADNYEAVARQIKAARLSCNTSLPSVTLIWCFVKELDGSISVYATTKDLRGSGTKEGLPMPDRDIDPMNECWVYRKVSAFEDANQMFQIFAFSAGQKNRIHTIRGMGYALYEAGQADNILRCKMMDAARHRASEIYETEVPISDIDDIQFIDVGHAMIMPKGLKGVPQSGLGRLDQSLGFALQSMGEVMDRHGMGLASNSVADNPNARRNEMQVTVEVEHLNKMQSFAISLFYNPYDNLIRELVRRAFTETQKDNTARRLVEAMKDACEVRGVPRDVFSQINFPATQATRLVGAGSKGSRMIGFQQLAQMYSSMDEQGQEFFNYDIASEIKGADAAERYFGLPGQRRGHVDIGLARGENNDLLEGVMMEPLEGENHMVHLQEHIEELVAGIQQVNEGSVDLADWTTRHIPLYKHTVETLEATSVHPSRMPEFNSYRQQLQQVGEVIDNGMRHINKLREEGQLPGQPGAPSGPGQPGSPANPMDGQVGPDGQPIDPKAAQEASAAQKDNDIKNAKMVAEAQAKIQMMAITSKAKIDINRQESIAKINALDAETAAKIRRQGILDRAGAGGG
jgi:hypothetical protein